MKTLLNRHFLMLARHCVIRRYAEQTVEKPSPHFKNLKANQKKFQIDDGVPIYLKKGLSDKVLFTSTVFLLFLGLGLSIETSAQLIMKSF